MHSGGCRVYSMSRESRSSAPRPSFVGDPKEITETGQDSTAPKVVTLDRHRNTWYPDVVPETRHFTYGHAHLSFSACGRYFITALNSCQSCPDTLLALWSRDTNPEGRSLWDCVPITNADKFAFPAAKISINFDTFNPLCVLTFWAQPYSGIDRALCCVHCFVLNLEIATITHCLHPITLYSERNSVSPPDTLASSFSGSAREEWITQMDMMERSSVLSKCGQYLVLSATIGAERFKMIVDLPNKEESTSKERATGSTGHSNPRVIEPKMTYWHQYRYWMSVYHQRILLHRSTRGVINRNTFSSLSCHVQLSVLPAHLAHAETWLLIPESNAAPMTILVTTKDHPPELWKLQVSWDRVIGKLKDLEAEHGDAIIALD